MSAYYFAKYDRVSRSGNVTSGTIACGEKESQRSILQFISDFSVAGSLEPYEIQFAPRHSSVSFLDPRYASAFHWHASCHLLLRRATLSTSTRLGAMRCSSEQRRVASRRDASRRAIRLHGCTACGPMVFSMRCAAPLFSSGTGIRVEFYHPRPQTSLVSDPAARMNMNMYARS